MVAALHANGNIGGDDLTTALTQMQQQFDSTRQEIMMGSEYVDKEEEQFVATKWWEKK